jgi:hypothetical protein
MFLFLEYATCMLLTAGVVAALMAARVAWCRVRCSRTRDHNLGSGPA